MSTATAVRENLYEGMFLVESSRFSGDPEGTSKAIVNILEKAGGTIVAHRPWQDGKLPYQIEGHRKGTHYLVCFRMPGAGMDSVNRACRLSDAIVRHMVIKHPPVIFDAMVAALNGTSEATEEGSVEETPAAEKTADEAPPAVEEAAAE